MKMKLPRLLYNKRTTANTLINREGLRTEDTKQTYRKEIGKKKRIEATENNTHKNVNGEGESITQTVKASPENCLEENKSKKSK